MLLVDEEMAAGANSNKFEPLQYHHLHRQYQADLPRRRHLTCLHTKPPRRHHLTSLHTEPPHRPTRRKQLPHVARTPQLHRIIIIYHQRG
ncbi:hypothetical protein K469DRAFT_332493 [Zopfia rhizophila CBS 207.26]|uniref:Uncharacterized protein n=1 Tax=Zopfia rhizophila CBS 207.26 TaxID=1314779 RepID=A0A6A6DHS0_9PEZI|nr:hypothetical protein K469DRAFT_332493 [Zopfia rhizophila CBS 207.26]